MSHVHAAGLHPDGTAVLANDVGRVELPLAQADLRSHTGPSINCKLKKCKSFGDQIIRYRAERIGGSIEIHLGEIPAAHD
jgi:hypothetical protein